MTASADRLPVNPVIIYDDLVAGQRATQVIGTLIGDFASELDLRPAFWRLNMLEEPCARISASKNVANSTVIVLSVRGAAGLSAPVAHWLKQCLVAKRVGSATVVALFGPSDNLDAPNSPRLQSLQDLVLESGLDFLAPESIPDPVPGDINADLHQRERAITPTLFGILHRFDCPASLPLDPS